MRKNNKQTNKQKKTQKQEKKEKKKKEKREGKKKRKKERNCKEVPEMILCQKRQLTRHISSAVAQQLASDLQCALHYWLCSATDM